MYKREFPNIDIKKKVEDKQELRLGLSAGYFMAWKGPMDKSSGEEKYHFLCKGGGTALSTPHNDKILRFKNKKEVFAYVLTVDPSHVHEYNTAEVKITFDFGGESMKSVEYWLLYENEHQRKKRRKDFLLDYKESLS